MLVTMNEQRAKRMEEFKAAMVAMVRANHPEVRPDMEVEIHPDAAIEFFECGLLDTPEKEWQNFLRTIREAKDEHLPEEELSEEEKQRLAHRLAP